MPYGVLCERALKGAVGAGKTEYPATAIQRLMTSSDHNNDLVTSQEKLEWVTPKISLMETDNTEAKPYGTREISLGKLQGPS